MQKPLNEQAQIEARKLMQVDKMIIETNALVDRIHALEEKGVAEFNRRTEKFKEQMVEWLENTEDQKVELEEFHKKLRTFKSETEKWAMKYDRETIQPVRDEFQEKRDQCLSRHLCIIEAIRIAQPELMKIEFKLTNDYTAYEALRSRDGYDDPDEKKEVEIQEVPPEVEALLQRIFGTKQ